jgi:hypothetical protein
MKKFLLALALSTSAVTAQAGDFDFFNNGGEWKMGPNGPYYEESDWPEWTPMYWMEEMMDSFDSDDDYGFGNMPFGGAPGFGGMPGFAAPGMMPMQAPMMPMPQGNFAAPGMMPMQAPMMPMPQGNFAAPGMAPMPMMPMPAMPVAPANAPAVVAPAPAAQ